MISRKSKKTASGATCGFLKGGRVRVSDTKRVANISAFSQDQRWCGVSRLRASRHLVARDWSTWSGEPSSEFTLTVVTGTPMCRRRVEMHFRGARGGVAGREAGGVVLKVFTATMEHVDLDDDVAVIHVRV